MRAQFSFRFLLGLEMVPFRFIYVARAQTRGVDRWAWKSPEDARQQATRTPHPVHLAIPPTCTLHRSVFDTHRWLYRYRYLLVVFLPISFPTDFNYFGLTLLLNRSINRVHMMSQIVLLSRLTHTA